MIYADLEKLLAVIEAQRETPEAKERIEELRQRTERNQNRPGGRAGGKDRGGKTAGREESGTRKGRQAKITAAPDRKTGLSDRRTPPRGGLTGYPPSAKFPLLYGREGNLLQKVKECRTCALHKRLFEELAEDQGRLMQEVLCRDCSQTPWAEWVLLEMENTP